MFNPKTAPRRPPDFRFPVSRQDLEGGAVRALFQAVLKHPVFAEISAGDGLELCARGLGYRDYAELLSAPRDPRDVALPYWALELTDFMTWTLATTANLSPVRVRIAVGSALEAVDLSVLRFYRKRTTLMRHPREKEAWTAVKNRGLGWSLEGKTPPGTRALLEDGRLYLHQFVLVQHDLARDFGEGPQWSTPAAVERAVDHACLPLKEAFSWEPSEASPPGLHPVSFYDLQGKLVGHGFGCSQVSGYLEQVYPPDGALLLEAVECLWRRKAAPPGLTRLPATLFVDGYENPFVLPDGPSVVDPVEAAFAMDVEPADRDAVPCEHGRLNLGRSVTLAGCAFTTAIRGFEVAKLSDFPGLELAPESQADSDDFSWLDEYEAGLLDQGSALLLRRVWKTLVGLMDSEDAWAKQPGSLEAMSALLKRTAHEGRPVQAVGTDIQSQGTGGMVASDMEFHSIPRVGKLYPELKSLPREKLGDYALDFYGKNGVRHDDEPRQRSVEFIRYATLRNLGLDPHAAPLQDHRVGVPAAYRLLRLALEQPGADLQKLAAQARSWLMSVYGALAVAETLDSSVKERREPAHPKVAGVVDYA